MSQIFILNCVITSDTKKNQSYVLSNNSEKIIFPIHAISSPRFISNETRYIVKNYFEKDTIQFLEQIVVSSSDLQNEFVINYLNDTKEIYHNEYNIDEDIFVLNCIVLHDKLSPQKLFWNTFNYSVEDKAQNPIFAIIDTSIQKSLV